MRRSVCVDLDGVLATYHGWKGLDHFGDPRPGALEFTQRLAEFADVVIYTTRCNEEMDGRNGMKAPLLRKIVQEWLDRHGFAYHDIYAGQGKPICSAICDDRAVPVPQNPSPGDFAVALELVRKHCLPRSTMLDASPEKRLIVLVGLPRSGKTTWAKAFSAVHGAPIVNPDAIRLAIHGQRFIAEAEKFVWATAHAMVKALFLAGHDTVLIDATNTTRKRRDEWKSRDWRTFFHVIDTPKDECLRRAEGDAEIHPVIERMASGYEPLQEDEIDHKEFNQPAESGPSEV